MRISENDRDHMPAERRVDAFTDPRLVPGVVFMDHDELYYVVSSPGRCQDPGLPGDSPLNSEIVLPLLLVSGPDMETIAGTVLETQTDVEALNQEVNVVDAAGSLLRWLEGYYAGGARYAWFQPGSTLPVPVSSVRFPVTAWY
jgi:hypothetical protein